MWQGIHGHDRVADQFQRMMAAQRLPSTFLFVGPEGIGKRAFAKRLAKGLLCQTATSIDPCHRCPSCRYMDAGNHPDFHSVGKPAGKSQLPIELLIGDKDHRLREGLCHDIALKPALAHRRVAVLDDADALHSEASNCLLKTLEEPPPMSVLILIGTSLGHQLPTIRSRCQAVLFQPLTVDQVVQVLLETQRVDDRQHARRLAEASGGSPGEAGRLADSQRWQFRSRVLEALGAEALDPEALSAVGQAYADHAGTNTQERRDRLRDMLTVGTELFRQWLRVTVAAPPRGDPLMRRIAQEAGRRRPCPDLAEALLARTLAAQEHLDRNVHLRMLLDAWLDDLDRLMSDRPAQWQPASP